jgi:hypothetical protein
MDLMKLGEELTAAEKAMTKAVQQIARVHQLTKDSNDCEIQKIHERASEVFQALRHQRKRADYMGAVLMDMVMELEHIMRHTPGHPGE